MKHSKQNNYVKSKMRIKMIPDRGKQKYNPERELFMKAQIIQLLNERDKYIQIKDNAKSKIELRNARLCLRTINDSIADYRKKVS